MELLGSWSIWGHENSTQTQTRVAPRQKWHAGTGGDKCGLKKGKVKALKEKKLSKNKRADLHNNHSLQQWALHTWRLHFEAVREIEGDSSDDEAPPPLPLDEISDAENLELTDEDEAPALDLPLDIPDPIPEVEKPVKKVSIPTRFTQDLAAPLDFAQLANFTDRCCCRAWTPTHTATCGAIRDRKTTFGGACKHRVDKDSTTVYDLTQNWCDQLAILAQDCDGHDDQKAALYYDSSEYWREYPNFLDKALTEKFGECEGGHNWSVALKVCGTHNRALNCDQVRTFGGPTGKVDKVTGKPKFHSLILGDNLNRGDLTDPGGTGDYHIQFNEQGFIWEDPTKMGFYNWEGSSSSGDQKAQKDGKWVNDPEGIDGNKCEIYGKSKAVWKIKNAIDRLEYPELASKWQEEGWRYL